MPARILAREIIKFYLTFVHLKAPMLSNLFIMYWKEGNNNNIKSYETSMLFHLLCSENICHQWGKENT